MGLRPELRGRLHHSKFALRTLVPPLVGRHLLMQVADDRDVRLLVGRHSIIART